MKRHVFIITVSYVFVMVFVYTALSKWLMYDVYVDDLRRSPQLGQFATLISYAVPAAELIVAGLLLFDKTRLWGLIGAEFLMIIFTIYVGWVLTFTSDRPCTCGGIIRDLSWTNHMILNSTLTILAAIAISIYNKSQRETNQNNKRHILNTSS